MTKRKEIKDWRSTGRRRARASLFESMIEYVCVDCGVTPVEPPKDAPKWFEEIWPIDRPGIKTISPQLQADHESKDLEINDESELAWRCPSCHKKRDSQTGKGIATREGPRYFG